MFSKLQYISQGETAAIQLSNIQQALDAGCKWIQLRFKNGTVEEITALAKETKKYCAENNATFIINDHPQIAKLVDADGVHLGLTDMHIAEAKNILSTGKIIGGTANTLEDVLQRVAEGCNYVGLGPMRFTPTKQKLSPILGFAGYEAIMKALKLQQVNIPVYAIGGILMEDISLLLEAGLYGVAVSGMITNHADKKILLQQFNTLLYATADYSK